jgi:hypothetical protein
VKLIVSIFLLVLLNGKKKGDWDNEKQERVSRVGMGHVKGYLNFQVCGFVRNFRLNIPKNRGFNV